MPNLINLIGQRFGHLTVLERAENNRHNQTRWRCRCECGSEKVVLQSTLARGDAKSCGCLSSRNRIGDRTRSHGKTGSTTYAVYRAMMQRCYDKNADRYADYGGRGIYVCDRWQTFQGFYADMGDRPSGMTLDRLDNSGPYSPENCQWRSYKSQARNRRTNRLLTFGGETLCVAEWGERTGIKPATIHRRIFVYEWPVERALTEPTHYRGAA